MPPPPPSQLSNPRRLFVLAPDTSSHALVPPFLQRLTGFPVQPDISGPNGTSTLAGYTTHPPLHISTKYYQADIPIWVDELPFAVESGASSEVRDTSPRDDGSQRQEDQNQDEDESDHQSSTLADWKASFLSPEAEEVRAVIGAIICCIPRPSSSTSASGENQEHQIPPAVYSALNAIADVKTRIEEERGEIGDVPVLLVVCGRLPRPQRPTTSTVAVAGDDDELSPETQGPVSEALFSVERWDEELSERGLYQFEVLEWDPHAKRVEEEKVKGARNEYGELQGIERIMEVLQTTEWNDGGASSSNAVSGDDEDAGAGLLDPEEEAKFEEKFGDMSLDMMDLHFAVMNGDDEHDGDGDGDHDRNHGELLSRAERRDNETEGGIQGENEDDSDVELGVEQLNALVSRMRTLKEIGSGMPLSERKKFAAKAVDDVMKNL